MPGLARLGDVLTCGDVIVIGSTNVTIEGVYAAMSDGVSLVTNGHTCDAGVNSHGGTALYPDQASMGTRPSITINGKAAGIDGDWNVPGTPTNRQVAPNFPDPHGSSADCPVRCGNTCHDSQVITTTLKTTAG